MYNIDSDIIIYILPILKCLSWSSATRVRKSGVVVVECPPPAANHPAPADQDTAGPGSALPGGDPTRPRRRRCGLPIGAPFGT